MNATAKLHALGQSLWLDNITRDLLNDGTLKGYIDALSVTGLTSNPTIFDHAVGKSSTYDGAIRDKLASAKSTEDLFFDLAIEDLTRAADLFRPIHERTNGVDGFVSLEVSPLLAYDTKSTLAMAKDLHARAGKPNLLIKIPGTTEGLPAIEEAIFAGIPINVTLLFSREHYVAAAQAYHRGIERRIAAGLDPDVASVASIFISRWDVGVKDAVPEALHNKLGIAIAGRIYKAYQDLLASPDVAAREQFRRAAATAALGQHRHQGSQRLRHPLHREAGIAVHGQHHARRHAEGVCRSRRGGCLHAAGRRRQRGRAGAVRQGRCRYRRPGSPAAGRGGEVLRQILARSDRRDRSQELGHQEGQLERVCHAGGAALSATSRRPVNGGAGACRVPCRSRSPARREAAPALHRHY